MPLPIAMHPDEPVSLMSWPMPTLLLPSILMLVPIVMDIKPPILFEETNVIELLEPFVMVSLLPTANE